MKYTLVAATMTSPAAIPIRISVPMTSSLTSLAILAA